MKYENAYSLLQKYFTVNYSKKAFNLAVKAED